MFLRFAYTVFIGVLLATFIGVGISAFYQQAVSALTSSAYKAPKYPEPPVEVKYARPIPESGEASPSSETIQKLEAQEQKYKEFNEQNQAYQRNISMIALSFAIVVLVLSLTLLKNIYVISDSFLLGGILTLIYSIVRGFGADDSMYRFAVTGVGLLAALILGYLKMVRPQKH